jgi:hypothetical protein
VTQLPGYGNATFVPSPVAPKCHRRPSAEGIRSATPLDFLVAETAKVYIVDDDAMFAR